MFTDLTDDTKIIPHVQSLTETVLQEIKTPSKLKNSLVFTGTIIGIAASFVYYEQTQEMIKEKNYPDGYSYLLIVAALGVNGLLNSFFNAQAVKIVFNLKDCTLLNKKKRGKKLNKEGRLYLVRSKRPSGS